MLVWRASARRNERPGEDLTKNILGICAIGFAACTADARDSDSDATTVGDGGAGGFADVGDAHAGYFATGGDPASPAGGAQPLDECPAVDCGPSIVGVSSTIDLDYSGPASVSARDGVWRLRVPSGEEITLLGPVDAAGLQDGDQVFVALRVRVVNDGALTLARLAVRSREGGPLRLALFSDALARPAPGTWIAELPSPEVFGFDLGFETQGTCAEPLNQGLCWTPGTATQRIRTLVSTRDGVVPVDDGATVEITVDGERLGMTVCAAREQAPDAAVCDDAMGGAVLGLLVLPLRTAP